MWRLLKAWSDHSDVGTAQGFVGFYARAKKVLARTIDRDVAGLGTAPNFRAVFGCGSLCLYPLLAAGRRLAVPQIAQTDHKCHHAARGASHRATSLAGFISKSCLHCSGSAGFTSDLLCLASFHCFYLVPELHGRFRIRG